MGPHYIEFDKSCKLIEKQCSAAAANFCNSFQINDYINPYSMVNKIFSNSENLLYLLDEYKYDSFVANTMFDTNIIGWNFYKENTMSLFNWFLVSKYEEGNEPIKSGFITSENEDSAREFIIRSLDKELFDQYKEDQFVLVVCEVDSWDI